MLRKQGIAFRIWEYGIFNRRVRNLEYETIEELEGEVEKKISHKAGQEAVK